MTPTHRLLARQLRKHFGDTPPDDPRMEAFLRAIESTYEQSDADRHLLDHAMKLSSDELGAALESLRQQNACEHDIIVKLRAAIHALGDQDLPRDTATDDPLELAAVMQQLVAERNANKAALEAAKEAAESSSRAKSEFLAVMSHEIRTPLNAVIGFASLMADAPDADHREPIDIIRRSGEHLLALINDILDFSKIEAGHLELASAPFDLPQLCRDALDFVRPPAAAKHLTLVSDGIELLPARIVSDAGRLRQILTNLLSNAVKFTPAGRVTLRVAATPRDAGWLLRCEVIDTGIGIGAEHLPRLFRAFSQVDSSNVRQHGGTGLGLAISRRLAELMGGSLEVESTLGAGSRFTLALPVGRVTETAPAVPIPATTAAAGVLRILVVEDNENNRRLMRLGLEASGYAPHFAVDGRAALVALARPDDFDVVFMDLQMPDVDGFGVVAELRKTVPLSRPPYLIALTASVRPEDRDRVLAAGMHEFIAKPAPIAEIRAALVRARDWLAARAR
ncbi:MAG: response regulator [Candidatus Didemnitutus sp.]|nr:response regulator [Candidatus Didemnitutus sp.]